MKYLVLFLLTSCVSFPDFREYRGFNKKERLMSCVDRYVDRDVEMNKAFKVCQKIYERT